MIKIIFIVILIGFLLFLLIRLIFYLVNCVIDYFKRLELVNDCTSTYYKIKNDLAFLISVGGVVGAGKTSFCVGCSQLETLKNIDNCKAKKKWIQTIIPYVNYDWLDKMIDLFYSKSNSPRKVYKSLLRVDQIHEYFRNCIYDDYVQKTPLFELLQTYIDAECALLRNRFIGSNITIKNVITGNTNFYYDYSSLEIKDEEKQKVYLLPKYFTIVEDEALTSVYKNTNSFKQTADTGLDLSMRLIRHLSKETCRIYSTAQNIERITKIIRELSTQFIIIQGYEIIGKFKTKDKRLKKIEEKLEDRLEDKMLFPSSKKNKLFRIHQKRKQLFASCYLKYKVIIYSKLEDINKSIDKCESLAYEDEFTFPLTWVFGCYDTYEFNFIDEFLSNLSNKKDTDLKIAKEVLSKKELKANAEAILKKVDEKEEKEEKVKKTKLEEAEEKKRNLFNV